MYRCFDYPRYAIFAWKLLSFATVLVLTSIPSTPQDEFGPVGAAELCGDQRTYQRNIFDTLTEERQDAPASAAAVATTAAADAADAAGGGGCDTDTGTGATGAGSSTGLAPHKHYPIPTAKGWTLQDPDLWANATILLASVVYFVYQIEVLSIFYFLQQLALSQPSHDTHTSIALEAILTHMPLNRRCPDALVHFYRYLSSMIS